jgi:hypothetical protein
VRLPGIRRLRIAATISSSVKSGCWATRASSAFACSSNGDLASWLNQIEIWFSILVRKLIRRGNFASKDMLKTRIEQFIAYFNATMAKPFRWTYAGKPLAG